MKKLQFYQCERCGTQYKTALEASKCEKTHQLPLKVKPARFNAMNNDGVYPQTVDIEFTDGKVVRYKK